MKALRYDGELRLIRDAPEPRRAGEALVQVIAAGICNTDLEIVKGYAGFYGTLGHEFVGRVVGPVDSALAGRRVVGEINAGCGECSGCRAGDARHCPDRTVLGIKGRDGGFAEYLSLPARNLIEIPTTLSDEAAVFVEPMAAALQVLEQVEVDSSTHVAVIGDGKLAQLVVRAIAHTGCRPLIVGKHRSKLELGTRAGARSFLIAGDLIESGKAALVGQSMLFSERRAGFDVVIETSGSATGLPLALAIVRPRGTVVLKSTHQGQTKMQMSAIVVNEITIVGSRCGRFRPAIDLLASGEINVNELITARIPLEEGVRAFEKASEPSAMKIILSVA
ncbi:MAG TPA: alcohol dehydrogenase catalytic domain-containing protein [Blastocatellia bacterium]|nr:alcohol dehydrogenase catalytic domain-containing protein [Blastocatellia bacterium]